MNKAGFIDRLRVFIILRLFIATFLLFLAQVVFRTDTLLFYYIIAAVSALSLFYLLWVLTKQALKFLAWLQIVVDLAIETLLIYCTGGVDSLFAPIYILSILSAGIMIAPGASFVIAGLSSLFFSGLVYGNYARLIPESLFLNAMGPAKMPDRDPLYLFYATYVRVTIFFIVAILTNHITRLVLNLEEKIRIQERLAFLGEITSGIAHEIRNPLAAISTTIEVIQKDIRHLLTPKSERLMTAVVDESERLKQVFSKILDYSRQDELALKRINLSELLNQILILIPNSIRNFDKVRLNRRYEGKKVFVEADVFQMQEAIANIIRNSYEAMQSGGSLTIDCMDVKSGAEVIVSDTGVGISKENLKSLFVPFKTTKKMGTGLGLAQSHKIVSQHGGKMSVHSVPQKGTEVRIFLPKK